MARARRYRAARFGVGRVLGQTFPIWLRNFVPFTILTVLVYAPRLLYLFAARRNRLRDTDLAWDFLVDQVLMMLVTAALIYGVLERLRDRGASIGACLGAGFSRFLPVLGVTVCVYLLALLAALPSVLLAALLRFPPLSILSAVIMVAILARYWMAVPVAVVERPGVVASLRRSAELTRGSGVAIFAILVLFYALWYAAFLILVFNAGTFRTFEIGSLILGMARGMLLAVACAVAYHDLRVAKEGIGTDDLVRVFA